MGELLTTRTTAFLKTIESSINDERIRNVINKLDDAYISMGQTRPENTGDRFRVMCRHNVTGNCPDDKLKLNVEIFRLVRKACNLHHINAGVHEKYHDWSDLLEDMLSICILHDLRPSTVNPMQLSYIPDVVSESRDRRVRGKPAKIIRKLFPLNDEQVENFFRMYNGCYNPAAFTLHHGCTAEDFHFAYATDDNFVPETDIVHDELASGNTSKAMSNSCMRWWNEEIGRTWQNENMHPAEIFATNSEYMHIAWTVDEGNRVASRACYSPTDNVCSSIYGTSMKSVYIIDDFFKEKGYRACLRSSSWPNFKVRRVEYDRDCSTVHMPYLDMSIRHFDDRGEHFVQGTEHQGGGSTRGCMELDDPYTCEDCGEHSRYEGTHDTWGNHYCDTCYSERYTSCRITGNELERESCIDIEHISLQHSADSSLGHFQASDFNSEVSHYEDDAACQHGYWVEGEYYSRLYPIMVISRFPNNIYVFPKSLHHCIVRSSPNNGRGGQLRSLNYAEICKVMDVLYPDHDSREPIIDCQDDSTIQVPILARGIRFRTSVLIMVDIDADVDDLIKSLSEQIKNELEGE